MDKERTCHNDALAQELQSLSYSEIESRIQALGCEDLIVLLNSRSRHVGDCAFGCLLRRPEWEAAVIRAICENRLTLSDGKVRAANLLICRGRASPDAKAAYWHLVDDRSDRVSTNALMGIVFSQDRSYTERIRSKLRALRDRHGRLAKELTNAIRALEEQNPFLFEPYYPPDQAEKRWGIQNALEKCRMV